MPLVATPGSSTANSYVTLAQADAYWEGDSLWLAQADSDREAKLIRATRDIERLGGAKASNSPARSEFPGLPYHCAIGTIYLSGSSQALHFPRATDIAFGGTLVIPESVQDAVCEQARWLVQREKEPSPVDHEDAQQRGVTSMSAGGVSVSYKPTGCPANIAPQAWVYIGQYVRHGSAKLV